MFLFKQGFKAAALFGAAVLICATAFLNVAPANAQNQDIRAVMGRLEQLENRINNTQSSNNATGYNDSDNGDVSGGSSAAMYETRIAELEAQLRQLNGKIEEQDYAINQIKSQFELFKGDLEMRLNDMAANGGSNAAAQAAPQQVAPVADPAVDTATDASTVNNMSVNNPAALYDEAFQALRGQDYTKAKAGFNEFIKRYPSDNLAGNAQYWLGETHYVQGEFKSAARVFAEGYKKYPKNNKAPDNLLKLALTLDQLGQKKEACVTLAQLAKQFPNAATVIKQRNTEEQKRLQCGG
jgi:tol-pal system protein YbgF